MTTDTKIVTVATNPKDVFHSGQLTTLKNSETLKGSASGEIIGIDNISPVEHIMDVKVRSKNMFDPSKLLNASGWTVTDGVYSGKSRPLYDLYVYKSDGSTGTPILTGFEVGKRYAIKYFGRADLGEGDGGGITFRFVYDDGTSSGTSEAMITSTTETEISYWSTSGKNVVGLYVHYWNNVQNYIRDIQVTEVTTAIPPFTPHIPDLSTVNVKTSGKNIFSYPYSHGTGVSNGITWTVNSDGSITANGTATAKSYFNLRSMVSLQAGKVFVQGLGDSYDKGISMCLNNIRYIYADDKTVNIPDGYKDTIYLFVNSGATVDNVLIKPPFACYNDDDIVKEYEVNSDGTVDGVTNLYPDTTLLTDTNGAIIDCNYYKDIDKTFDELLTNVALSGGEG